MTRRFLVSGRVQGVGYRWYAAKAARSLGIVGYVRNLDDGRVEIVASGTPELLDQLARALGIGPAAARVIEVSAAEVPDEPSGFNGFSVS
jgi:acylphosphatase